MEAIDVFIAYSQQDKHLMEQFKKQLSAAERIGLVDSWHDGEIGVGLDREEAAREAMEKAEIIVLLLSADFFASEYLYEKEMDQALDLASVKKARVIPVLLKECTWQLTPLAKLKVLPENAIPVTNEYWKSPDRAFKQVVDKIINISNSIRQEQGNPAIPYHPQPHQEDRNQKTVTKTISKNEAPPKEQASLWKIVVYAFLGLAAFALISFILNQWFIPPTPSDPQKEDKETPIGQKDETPENPVGDQPKETDSPKASFATIQIDQLEWSAQNMNTPIGQNWCYENKEDNCQKYGRLYDFDTALAVCPEGWRLPTKEEWLALTEDQIRQLQLYQAGVQDRGGFRQLDQIGYYMTGERSHAGNCWVIEYRGDEKELVRESRYTHWGMSCRCVR